MDGWIDGWMDNTALRGKVTGHAELYSEGWRELTAMNTLQCGWEDNINMDV
jgi:hypothetical protein